MSKQQLHEALEKEDNPAILGAIEKLLLNHPHLPSEQEALSVEYLNECSQSVEEEGTVELHTFIESLVKGSKA